VCLVDADSFTPVTPFNAQSLMDTH